MRFGRGERFSRKEENEEDAKRVIDALWAWTAAYVEELKKRPLQWGSPVVTSSLEETLYPPKEPVLK
jgi:hypothetical protein